MVLGRVVARVKYGSIVEEGQFEDHIDEYRDQIYDLEEVDVEVEEWFDPVPTQRNLLTPTSMNTSKASAEELSGQDAWEFANTALEEMTGDNNLENIPFYFEHRSRGADDMIRMGAKAYSTLGSEKEYRVTFDN